MAEVSSLLPFATRAAACSTCTEHNRSLKSPTTTLTLNRNDTTPQHTPHRDFDVVDLLALVCQERGELLEHLVDFPDGRRQHFDVPGPRLDLRVHLLHLLVGPLRQQGLLQW